MFDLLDYGFGQRALIGGIIIAALCGPISLFVVVRRMAFAGAGISHTAFGGVAIGLALGISPVAAAAVFCVAVALGIGWFSRRGGVHEDTAIGILFSFSMALGVLLLKFSKSYNVDLMSYLFGSILALSWNDVIIIGAWAAIATILITLFFKELLFISFDEETATASGLPVKSVYYGFLVMMAVTIVLSIKLVGIILVTALLVIPGAAGIQLFRNYRNVLAFSTISGVLSVSAGLFLSSWLDVASGATIVLVLFGVFVISAAFNPRRSVLTKSH